MSKLADFNIVTSRNKNRHRSTSSCSVVINNANNMPTSKPKPKPSPIAKKCFSRPNGASTPSGCTRSNNLAAAPRQRKMSVVYPPPKGGAEIAYPEVSPLAYPPGQDHLEPQPVIQERSVTLEVDEDVVETQEETPEETTTCREELYKLIAATYGDILKTNNSKLIANIIDMSGKVIVEAEKLVNIIALACQVSPEDVTIEYETGEGGCCASITRIKRIENIRIGSYDFKLAYNDIYNTLSDTYSVSLKRTIIPLEDLV